MSVQSYKISRLNPKSGIVEQPYRDKDGQFILANPAGGAQRHHAKYAVKVSTTAEAVEYIEKGFPIRMTDGQSAPSLVSAKSVTITPVDVEGEDESSLGSVATRNPLPTKDALMDELKQLLCVQAGHIALSGSDEAAAAFIGFESKSWDPYEIGSGEWKKVDLSRFDIRWRMSKAYDFAYQCGEYWGFEADHAEKVRALVDGIPPREITSSSYEFMGKNGLCQRIADTAYARWKLLDGCPDLTIRELSLLANITESATRTSLSREGISAPDGKLLNDQALAWLRGQRGFIPTKSTDTSVKDQTLFWSEFAFRQLGLAAALTRLITEWMKTTPDDIQQKAGVSREFMEALMAGHPLLDLDGLQRVGRALDIDVPQFVGLAVQEALRAEKGKVFGERAA